MGRLRLRDSDLPKSQSQEIGPGIWLPNPSSSPPHHLSLLLIETDRHNSGRNVRRKCLSSQKALGKPWLAFRILPGWEGGGGEFIYRQKGSTSSRRRKMNDINFSHSYHWDWA